jgi:hypothetical protein
MPLINTNLVLIPFRGDKSLALSKVDKAKKKIDSFEIENSPILY